jgi:hypothetical protein
MKNPEDTNRSLPSADVPSRLAGRERRSEPAAAGGDVLRIVGIVLVLLTLLLLPAGPALTFSDVPSTHPYSLAIEKLSEREIVSGRADGSFQPDQPLLRAQFAKMIVRTLSIPVEDDSPSAPFADLGPDVPGDPYPHQYVGAAYLEEISVGSSPDRFDPYSEITRAQLLTMVVRALDRRHPALLGQPPPQFAGLWGDFGAAHSPEAKKAFWNALDKGLNQADFIDPWAAVTRGEAANILWNALALIEQSSPTAPESGDTPPPDSGDSPTPNSRDSPPTQPLAVRSRAVTLTSGAFLADILFRWPAVNREQYGLLGTGLQGASIQNVRTENAWTGIKLGSGELSSGIELEGFSSQNDVQSLFLANVSDSSFRDLDLSVDSSGSYGRNHAIYLERGNSRLSFHNVRLRGGQGQALHLYHESGAAGTGRDILFDGLDIVSASGPIVIYGYERVTIRNARVTGGADRPIVQLGPEVRDLVIENVEAWGGSSFLGVTDGADGVQGVTLRNITYHGDELVYNRSKIDGLALENVRLTP